MVTYSPNSFFERGRGSIYKSPPKSKPKNANQQAAQSMLSVGIGGISGKTTTSSAQKIQDRFKEQTQKDSGSTKGLGAKPNITIEEVDTPNALTKKERIYEALMAASAAVGLTAPQPTKAYTYDPMKVYTSEMVRPQGLVGYDAMFPTDATLNAANPPYSKTVGGNQQPLYTPDTRGFGQSVDNRALFERLDDPFRLGQGTDTTPNMGGEITNPNMDMVSPTIPNPVIPESPSGVDRVSRAISQAMLPTEVEYTIQDGDTLSEIAREAGTTVEELKELNNIDDIDIIDAGSNLKVPVKSGKLTDTQAALRRGLGSKKDNKGIKVAGGTMEELRKLLRAYTDQMEGEITTDPDPDAQFYNSFNQDVTTSDTKFVQDAITQILDNEGGYNGDSSDRGNIIKRDGSVVGTMKGITPRTYANHVGKNVNDVTIEEMKAITEETAREIYKDEYWTKPKMDLLPEEIQENVFDMGVNSGSNAVKILQRLADMPENQIDGSIGPITLKALEESDISNNDYVDARIAYYKNIVNKNPSQRKFLNGWINRAEEYRK